MHQKFFAEQFVQRLAICRVFILPCGKQFPVAVLQVMRNFFHDFRLTCEGEFYRTGPPDNFWLLFNLRDAVDRLDKRFRNALAQSWDLKLPDGHAPKRL